MASFFQRGELLAADAVGVPADEVRGDEDEHRAHGRGQKQLIRIEVAAGVARRMAAVGSSATARMMSGSMMLASTMGSMM